MQKEKEKLTDKPRTLSEIANFYSVSKKTMKKWLDCETLRPILRNKVGSYYSIYHIEKIIEHLGEP
ncbi:MAG TPA: hypothetical protein PK495_07550, partial [Bacteroidales bacterium]|nr:hypothetical protein [Bacteroidales bacterium]